MNGTSRPSTSDAVPSTPTTPSSASSQTDAAENLRIMMEGRVFDRFYFIRPPKSTTGDVSPSAVESESILLWYEPSMKLGTFYWCPPNQREKIEGQSIPLSSISDIFLGRQTPELKSALASGGHADQCFSITSKKQSLHLRGESAAVRSAFLAGIRHVWTKPTMVTQTTPNIQAMISGANFISLTGSPITEKREVFVWYESVDTKLGTLYWCDSGTKEKIPGCSLQLHRISDVYLGKQAAEMKSPEAAGYPSHNCFSIIAKDRSIHLIAASEAVRTTWLAGIKDVFANVGKKASDSKDRKTSSGGRKTSRSSGYQDRPESTSQPAPAAALASQSHKQPAALDKENNNTANKPQLSVQSTPDQAILQPSESDQAASVSLTPRPDPVTQSSQDQTHPPVPLFAEETPKASAAVRHLHAASATEIIPKTTLLATGHVFTSFSGTNPTIVSSVFVWYDDHDGKLGTLYWNSSTERLKNKVPNQAIPFHRISDVFMGKQSVELKSSAASSYPSNVCFSVVSKNDSLHLAAESEAVRMEFLSNIKQIFVQSGKKVDEERAKTDKKNGGTGLLADGQPLVPLPALSSPYLEKGHQFISYTNEGSPTDVLVWYENAGNELGWLHWNANGVKEPTESQRLAVPFISDIFMGKQIPPLEYLSVLAAPDNCCWSLVSADGALHLQSALPSQRTEWLSALRDLFVLAGKRTQQEAQELVINQALLDNPKRALLMKGGRFTAFFGKEHTVKQDVLVWYAAEDAKLGTLYWSNTGEREKSSERCIPLHRVSDVFMGKQTTELKSEAARDTAANRCFSVLMKDRGLHLAAESEAARSDWLSAIKSLFIESGKKVDDEKNRKKDKDIESSIRAAQQAAAQKNQQLIEKEAAISGQPLPSQPTSPVSGAVAPIDPLQEGRDYLAIFPSSLATASSAVTYWSRPVSVFFDLGGDPVGKIYWCERGKREKIEEQSIPLSKVSDVFLGKQTDATRSIEGNKYESKQCVSVVTKALPGRDLHLVAPDEKARQEFVVSLRSIFARAAKPGFNLTDPQSIIEMMERGEEVTSYIGSGIIGSSIPAYLWFVKKDGKLGTIYWNEERRKDKVEGNSLNINHITDVFVGKKTPELLSVEGLFANSDHCLSVMSKKNSIHVEFKSTQMRDAWLTGVKNAYAAAGRLVKESKPGDQPGTRITTIVSAKNPQNLKVSPVLLQGRPFVRYQMVGDTLKKKKIHLWLDKQEGTADRGTLYYEDLVEANKKQPMIKRPESSIQVNTITDIYMGKQTAVFSVPELNNVPVDCCFSIATKDQNLDLAAKYPSDRKIWLTAIHSVFVSSGKKVVDSEKAVTKIVMDQPVWTPFGEGLAARYPRHDMITPVQLPYGIAYVNLESLHRLVHVNTPLGPGILLPIDKKRTDDTIPVELAYGVAYLPKSSIIPMKSTSAPPSREISPRTSVVTTPATQPQQQQPVPTMTNALSGVRQPPVSVPPSPSDVTRTSYTKAEALTILTRGTPFSIVNSANGGTYTTLIVAWLAADEGVLGTLYYNPADKSGTSAVHSIPVHAITDVYLGDIHFPSTPATPSVSNRALSIVGRGEEWNMLADSTAVRNAWYYSLHALISSSGKDVISEEKPSPVASESGHHYQYQKPAEPDYDEATHTLQQGSIFTQHIIISPDNTQPPQRQKVYVWYDSEDGDLGSLYTTRIERDEDVKLLPPPDHRNKDGVWNLGDIRDLFLGNRNFRKNVSAGVENDHCLSLVLQDKSELNLQARNKQQRDQVFYSIVSVLKNGPKMLDTEDEYDSGSQSQEANRSSRSNNTGITPKSNISQPSPASNIQEQGKIDEQKSSPPATPAGQQQPSTPLENNTPSAASSSGVSSASSPSNPTSIVENGIEMTVWTGDEQQSAGVRQFVFWEPPEGKRRLGTLYWCDVGERVRVPNQELPLHYISDVFLGKTSAAFKSANAQHVPSSLCFVLVSKNLSFNAQTNTEKEREQWLKSFKKMFTQSGKKVIDQKNKAATATSPQSIQSSSDVASGHYNTDPNVASHRDQIA